MDFKQQYGSTDPKELAEWFELNGAKFLVAPIDSVAFRNETLRVFRVGDIQEEGLNERSAYEVMELECGIKAKAVLLNWESVKNGDEDVPYSINTAKAYLINYDEFRNWVDERANELVVKRHKHANDAKKK